MLQNLKKDLKSELQKYMSFWMDTMVQKDGGQIYPEMSSGNVPNEYANMGAMYLSRIIFGASRAGIILQTMEYKNLADSALQMLCEFKNPSGGYYWARSYNMKWIHDPVNVNLAQAFVLYGLVEYGSVNPSLAIDELIDEQVEFIQYTLLDDSDNSFIDGYDVEWKKLNNLTKSFGTHFHLMESFVKLYKYKRNPSIRSAIVVLIRIILDKFIDSDGYACIQRMDSNWDPLTNEVWFGHNAECSWTLCNAAQSIEHDELIERTSALAVKMMDKVIELSHDRINGGYFNRFTKGNVLEKNKIWWPQSEITIGLLNVYRLTDNSYYENLAIDQIQFIQNNFIAPNGEWFAEITSNLVPKPNIPLIHFWKCMYHSLKYYNELLNSPERL